MIDQSEHEFREKFKSILPDIRNEQQRELAEALMPIASTVYRIGFMEGHMAALKAFTGGKVDGTRVN